MTQFQLKPSQVRTPGRARRVERTAGRLATSTFMQLFHQVTLLPSRTLKRKVPQESTEHDWEPAAEPVQERPVVLVNVDLRYMTKPATSELLNEADELRAFLLLATRRLAELAGSALISEVISASTAPSACEGRTSREMSLSRSILTRTYSQERRRPGRPAASD